MVPRARLSVALAHDYITQRGGAERVVAIMAEAFPGAPLFTSLYDQDGTFAEFSRLDLRTSMLNRVPVLRHHHRLAFPLLAPMMSTTPIDAEVLLASSSGWAHAIPTTGSKVVYCHAPARWLYQADRYLGPDQGMLGHRARRALAAAALGLLGPALRTWDRRAAASADRYLVNSSVVRQAVVEVYGIEAEVLPPPPALLPGGPQRPVESIMEPFVLCVARLLPYKNVDVVIEAVKTMLGLSLVVVGQGPDESRLRGLADGDPSIHILGGVDEDVLRWLYASCVGLVAASFEDFGLTPLEAATFGKPTAALHAGGYLDTVNPEINGLFFPDPSAGEIGGAIDALVGRTWSHSRIAEHAEDFSKERFCGRLRDVVAEVAA